MCDNLEEMDLSLERHSILKVTQERMDNKSISVNKIEPIINNFLKQKVLGTNEFTGEFFI